MKSLVLVPASLKGLGPINAVAPGGLLHPYLLGVPPSLQLGSYHSFSGSTLGSWRVDAVALPRASECLAHSEGFSEAALKSMSAHRT